MFYNLLYPLHTEYSFLNVFRYITLRTGYALLTVTASRGIEKRDRW